MSTAFGVKIVKYVFLCSSAGFLGRAVVGAHGRCSSLLQENIGVNI